MKVTHHKRYMFWFCCFLGNCVVQGSVKCPRNGVEFLGEMHVMHLSCHKLSDKPPIQGEQQSIDAMENGMNYGAVSCLDRVIVHNTVKHHHNTITLYTLTPVYMFPILLFIHFLKN